MRRGGPRVSRFDYKTQNFWSRSRRVVAKAERLGDKDNPRFIVTSLPGEASAVYDKFGLRARRDGELHQGATAGSVWRPALLGGLQGQPAAAPTAAVRLRLRPALVERLRAFALKGTGLARASAGTTRIKLFKLAAPVETSTAGRAERGCA